jgi:hypothetical protein
MGFLFKSREHKAAINAVNAAKADPKKISNARSLIAADGLSNSERISLYEQLAEAPRYRNQRDNSKNPDSTCNLTSMAMAFEGLGMDLGDSERIQGEENLYGEFYKKNRSRTEEYDRASFARDKGLDTDHIETPNFSDKNAAKKWFTANVLPLLEQGAQATMGIKQGTFKHVVRLQWVEPKGLRIDDPWGQSVGHKGQLGYAQKNPTKRDNIGDQQGSGNNSFLDWATVAKICSDRYVQIYNKG